jgi:uncharacterized membrane protein YgdD (TMEM256/DUF423 family)
MVCDMDRVRSLAWTVFVLVAVIVVLFGVFPGTWFGDGTIDRDAQWLVTSYAAVAAILTLAIAVTAFRRGERWAWLAFWVWPGFFVLHGSVVFVGDFVFAALTITALLIARPKNSAAV